MDQMFKDFQQAFEAELKDKEDQKTKLQIQNHILKMKLEESLDRNSELIQTSTQLKIENEGLKKLVETKNSDISSINQQLNAKDSRMEAYVDGLLKRICELDLKVKYSKTGNHEFNENQMIEKLRKENLKLFVKIGKLKEEFLQQQETSSVLGIDKPNTLVKTSPAKEKTVMSDGNSVNGQQKSKNSAHEHQKPLKEAKIRKSQSKPEILIPQKRQQEPFKFEQVVRKKHLRAQMHGTDCACCSNYYNATKELNPSENNHQQQISRHRVWSKRPETPPGFWDVDFPNTQQLKEYKLQK